MDPALSTDLPKLPGNHFVDPRKQTFNKKQTFKVLSGSMVVHDGALPAGNSTQVKGSAGLSSSQLSTKRGMNGYQDTTSSKQPKWMVLEKKVLRFYAFFREPVHESAFESERIRKCVILYHLEDNTVSVVEPRIDNSGIPQGALIKRHKALKDPDQGVEFEPEDFNIGEHVTIYGKTFYIVDLDKFTRDFLESTGISVPEPQGYPGDKYTEARNKPIDPVRKHTEEDMHLKRFLEVNFSGRASMPSRDEKIQIQKYLEKDRQVLKFKAFWDERDNLYGEGHFLTLYYYLSDDTMEICEVGDLSGKDPFPVFLKRQKVPKHFTGPSTSLLEQKKKETVTEKDLYIGAEISIFGRTVKIYDCDTFTKKYYMENYGMTEKDFEPIEIKIEKKERKKPEPPPHNGFGDEEDSLGSWKYLVLKPPKKDMQKLLNNDKNQLRFLASFSEPKEEDKDRKFVITIYLADDTLSIYEPSSRNSGIIGGQFLARSKVKKSETEYFKPYDFYVGAEIKIHGYKFTITDTDERSLRLMEERTREFSQSDLRKIAHKIRENLFYRFATIRDAFQSMDRDHNGYINFHEFKQAMEFCNLPLTDQELITIMRQFDSNRDGRISYMEFYNYLAPKDFDYKQNTNQFVYRYEPSGDFQPPQEGEMEGVKKMEEDEKKEFARHVAIKKLLERIHQRPILFSETFRIAADSTEDGKLGLKEFERGIAKFSLTLPPEEMDMLKEEFFGKDLSKRYTYLEFHAKVDAYSSSSIVRARQ